MCRAPRINSNRKNTEKQIAAVAFLVCFIVVSLLSEPFVLTRVNHVHDHTGIGGACGACAQIQNAENILKQLGMTAVAGFAGFAGLYTAAAMVMTVCRNTVVLTPVASKIRMNN